MRFLTQGEVIDVLREGMMVAFKMAAPLLLVSIVVGLVIAIFQAATQIHEQTLTFVPKVVVIALLLLLTGSWMMTLLGDYMKRLFMLMTNL